MTLAEFAAALPTIGWNLRPVSPVRPDGTAACYRLLNHHGEATHIEVQDDRIMAASTSNLWGPSAGRAGSHGAILFSFRDCQIENLGTGCVSIHCNGAFINLYNHEKKPDAAPQPF